MCFLNPFRVSAPVKPQKHKQQIQINKAQCNKYQKNIWLCIKKFGVGVFDSHTVETAGQEISLHHKKYLFSSLAPSLWARTTVFSQKKKKSSVTEISGKRIFIHCFVTVTKLILKRCQCLWGRPSTAGILSCSCAHSCHSLDKKFGSFMPNVSEQHERSAEEPSGGDTEVGHRLSAATEGQSWILPNTNLLQINSDEKQKPKDLQN